jgi:hypothetical protein
VSAQARQSGVVNKTPVESKAQDDDFQEVKRCKRLTSNNIWQTAKNSTRTVPTSTAVKLPPKAVSTRKFFTPLRTTVMDMEATGAENTIPEQEALRKPGRLPLIIMASTTNLIRLQIDLKDHVKGAYKFKNTLKVTCIIINEMANYSAIESYMEKNNFHHFTISPNSEQTTTTHTQLK